MGNVLALVGALLLVVGCASSSVPPAATPGQQTKLNVVELNAAGFAPAVEQVIGEAAASDRLARLAAVARYQLGRADWLFRSGHDAAGLSAVSGAFYLLRAGELRLEMIEGREPALRRAVTVVANAGDEGRARALYSMLERVLPNGAERSDVRAHLGALSDWQRSSVVGSSMQAAGALQRSAVNRALLEPTLENYKAAQEAVVSWINKAKAFNNERRLPPQTQFESEEWNEHWKATRTGALILTALSLRFRDAMSGVTLLEQADIAPVVPSGVHDILESAASGNSPESWAELFGAFEGIGSGEQETELDPELARGAAWGAAIELYRSDPGSLRAVIPLASLLVGHQMSDAATLLVVQSLGKSPDPRELGLALHLITEALRELEALADLTTARGVFEHAEKLIAFAETANPELKKGFVALHFGMGEMEARSGDFAKAREHIVAANALVPSFEALRLLSAIDRQRGKPGDVIASLNQMLALSEQAGELAAQAETRTVLFEVYRELGQQNDARVAIEAALRGALKARASATLSAEQASSERVLARVLEQYGDREGARRATERAFEASQSDARQFTATVLDSARRALTIEDLPSARNAVRRALEGQIDEQDLIYSALWLKLLERQLKAPSDGTIEEALTRIVQRSTWPATLRDWALGKLNDEGLLLAAKTRLERAEALFYTAMAARVSGKLKSGNDGLKSVVSSEAIELVEVTIARDFLARDTGLFKPVLPSGVVIP